MGGAIKINNPSILKAWDYLCNTWLWYSTRQCPIAWSWWPSDGEICTLKKCLLLKIENNSSWVNFTHFWGKIHLLALEINFISSSLRVYMYIKSDIWNERLEWYKKRYLFAYRVTQNNSNAWSSNTHTVKKWK